MEKKKNNSVNIEGWRKTFFIIGVLCSLTFVLIALEWTSEGGESVYYTEATVDNLFEEDIINTYEKKPEEIKPPEPEITTIELIDNTMEESFDDIVIDNTIDENTIIDFTKYNIEDEKSEPVPFALVEVKPTFKNGGYDKFVEYIYKKISYPAIASQAGIEGKVIIGFTINEQGEITNIKVLRGAHQSLDQEALRVIGNSPGWKPGKQRNQPVKVNFTMPIYFRLS